MAQRTLSRRNRRRDEDDDYDDRTTTRDRDDEDDSYDDRPRGGSRRRDDDDEDDEPRGSRSRGRRSDRDDDEDERPTRSRSRRDEDDEPPRRSRRTRDEDDDRRRPRGRDRDSGRSRERGRDSGRDRGRGRDNVASTVGRGWGGYEDVKDTGGDYIKTWKTPKKPTLIKILDDEPFSTYAEHWLDEQKGKKSFVCLGDDCPLCEDLGDKPRGYALFNILDLSDPDHPRVEVLKTGKRVAGMLKEYSEDRKTSPLNREDLYWSIFNSGDKGGNVQTNLNPVKARDLVEDWDCDPFTDEELEEFEEKLHTEDEIINIVSRKELRAIAASYDD